MCSVTRSSFAILKPVSCFHQNAHVCPDTLVFVHVMTKWGISLVKVQKLPSLFVLLVGYEASHCNNLEELCECYHFHLESRNV